MVAVFTVLGFALGALLADRVPFLPEPATFNAIYARVLGVMMVTTPLGCVVGLVVAASAIARGPESGKRWKESVALGLGFLATCGATVAMLDHLSRAW